MFTSRPLLLCLITAILVFPLASSGSDDRDQPVAIKADEVDMDLKSGRRLYLGNVSVTIGVYPQEGSIRIRADQIEMTFSNEQLTLALATGDPARFRQRPVGKNHDVVGKGQTIKLDEVKNVVTLSGGASLKQQQDTVCGDTIVYYLSSGKLRVRGDSNSVTQTILGGECTDKSSSATTTRARMVMRPDALDKKPANTGEGASVSSDVIIGPSVVYAQPSVDSLIIGQFSPNTPIVVHSRAEDWVRVIPPSGTLRLWVYGKYLTKTADHSSVRANGIRIRTKPSTDTTSVVVGFLNRGDQVNIIGQRGLWSAIDLPTKVAAWVTADTLHPVATPK
ncbi:MAG: lipopolysaccharide transport periplasmic protein LptA [Arenicellales bacterium]|jgi:lipopolysaccharide export system protein LptA|nr:lipopolysaccharide transport periplasmic protein LptA [Arenicellales bacterium]